jgi:2-oxoglutarate ferredoxin oxidoreductase subunit beta
MFDKDLPDLMAQAIAQPGFALLDVWELCTAYYAPRNQVKKKKELDELLQRHELKLGVLHDKPRPEYSVRYREAYAAGRPAIKRRPPIVVEYTNNVQRQTGIIIAGSAGQKIRSTATLLGQAAMFSGLHATQKDDYPITVMTGHSQAELIFSRETIDYTAIESPDYLLVISEDGLKKTREQIQRLPASCTIYTDAALDLPPTQARVVRLPLNRAAGETSRQSLAVVAVAALLNDTGLFPVDALAKAISTFQKPKIAAVNLQALKAGAGMSASSPRRGVPR